jgi:hypothetical protein
MESLIQRGGNTSTSTVTLAMYAGIGIVSIYGISKIFGALRDMDGE